MWGQIIAAVAQGANSGSKNGPGGVGGASGYGLANTSSVASDAVGKAFSTSPFDSSNWTVATGSAKASATNTGGGSFPPSVLIVGGALLLVVAWKKLR